MILSHRIAALWVAVWPVAAFAHEGHDHGKRAKKVKKSKAKQAGIEFAVPRRVA